MANELTITVKRELSPVPTVKKTNRPTELEEITPQLAGLKYPVTSREDLVRRLVPGHQYFFRGKAVTANQMIARMPATFFPIESQDDFLKKIAANIKPRRPIPIKPVVEVLTHPTSVGTPTAIKGSGKGTTAIDSSLSQKLKSSKR